MLAAILALFLVGLLQTEQGIAELEGRSGEPSRILRLVPHGHGIWQYALLGHEGLVSTRIRLYTREPVLVDAGRPIDRRLPALNQGREQKEGAPSLNR